MDNQWKYLSIVTSETVKENIISYQYAAVLFLSTIIVTLFISFTSYFSDNEVKNNLSTAVYILMAFLMVYVAMRAISSFSGELDAKTLEVLLSLPIKRWAIYFGKIQGLVITALPLVIIPFLIYLGFLSIVTGAIPTVLLGILFQYVLLSIMVIIAIISICAFLSMILKKTVYSFGVAGAYLLLMFLLSSMASNFSSQVMRYDVNYAYVFLMPYAALAAGTQSIKVLNVVDPTLFLILLAFTFISCLFGYSIMRRMDL